MSRGVGLLGLVRLAWLSSLSRKASLVLLLLCISTSASLLLALDLIRQSARESFSQSVSGTDLVVGGPGSPLSLLLYSVFRLGEPARQLPIQALEAIQKDRRVAWVVPLSLGDSYRGYSVVGTTGQYFEHFKYGNQQALQLAQGRPFGAYASGQAVDVIYEAVLGAEVARKLNHQLGDNLVLSHGVAIGGAKPMAEHGDKPFVVVGVLAPTGTPVDRSVHISLQGMEAIHLDWQGGAPLPGFKIPADMAAKFDLNPKQITAALVGLHNRAAVFGLKRQLENQAELALTVALPGVALAQLWALLANVEQVLWLVAALVGLVSVLGLVGVMLMSLQQRQAELAILRSVGAGRGRVLTLLLLECALVMLTGIALAYGFVSVAVLGTAAWAQSQFGLTWVPLWTLQEGHWAVLLYGATGVALGLVPAWLAYRKQVYQGLNPQA